MESLEAMKPLNAIKPLLDAIDPLLATSPWTLRQEAMESYYDGAHGCDGSPMEPLEMTKEPKEPLGRRRTMEMLKPLDVCPGGGESWMRWISWSGGGGALEAVEPLGQETQAPGFDGAPGVESPWR
jgi:hypothetical protein